MFEPDVIKRMEGIQAFPQFHIHENGTDVQTNIQTDNQKHNAFVPVTAES